MMRTKLKCELVGEAATERLGAALADVLPAGSVVALVGPLGAGKTRLVQAVAAAVGVPRVAVTSPTFVLVNEYRQGRLPVFHFDTYRLKDDDEFLELGPDEYFESDGLSFVEWADRVADLLPADRLEIALEVTGETARRATITSSSQTAALVDRLAAALDGGGRVPRLDVTDA
jgi:tRNA threonylcarbamoyladenosine biosynthesis protein TsaE